MKPLTNKKAEEIRQHLLNGKKIFLQYVGEADNLALDRQVLAIKEVLGKVRAQIQNRIMPYPVWIPVNITRDTFVVE